MPTFMDPRTGRIVREYDDEHEPMIDYADLRRRMLLAAVERLSSGNAGKDAAELELMKSQATRNYAEADATRTPKDPVADARNKRDQMRADPEAARGELLNPESDGALTRGARIDAYVNSLQPGYDMAKVAPGLEKIVREETEPFAAAGDDSLAAVKDELTKRFWGQYDKRGLWEQRGGRGNKLSLQSSWSNPHGGEWLTDEEHAARNPVRAANFGRPFGGG